MSNFFQQPNLYIRLIAWLICSTAVGYSGCSHRPDLGKLVIEMDRCNLGDLAQWKEWNQAFKLTNTRLEPIRIIDTRVGCSFCTKAQVRKLLLKPGENTYVDTRVLGNNRRGEFASSIDISWIGEKSATSGTTRLLLEGVVTSVIDKTPNFLDFGEVSGDDKPVERVVHITRGRTKLAWDNIECSSKKFAVSTTPKSQDEYDILCKFYPNKYSIGMVSDNISRLYRP